MTRVCFFSNDHTLQTLLSSTLGRDFHLSQVADIDEMDQLLPSGEFDVMLLDLNSNDENIKERIEYARGLCELEPPCVILADDVLRSTANELVEMGAHGYCRRPPAIRDLRNVLRRAHESSSLKTRLQTVERQLEAVTGCDRMIGASPRMQQVYRQVRSVAGLNVSVLITGQSGTGKELIARAIHNLGAYSKRPFVAVPCGAIPETLIEAELFGHEKGAYTGTVGAREGYFEQAGDGTVFLDEIGELSLLTQVKLLRVLQQREFSRLGSNRLIPVRARFIFATNQNLGQMVAEGKFRQDLFYRINVVEIESPPLKERPEDVREIVAYFLQLYSQMYQKQLQSVSPDALILLQRYPWPGNVRELENVIQRAIVCAQGTVIRAQVLPQNFQTERQPGIDSLRLANTFEQRIHEFKLKLATTAIQENNGNKTLAAQNLGISRAYLHRLIRLLDPEEQLDGESNLVYLSQQAHG